MQWNVRGCPPGCVFGNVSAVGRPAGSPSMACIANCRPQPDRQNHPAFFFKYFCYPHLFKTLFNPFVLEIWIIFPKFGCYLFLQHFGYPVFVQDCLRVFFTPSHFHQTCDHCFFQSLGYPLFSVYVFVTPFSFKTLVATTSFSEILGTATFTNVGALMFLKHWLPLPFVEHFGNPLFLQSFDGFVLKSNPLHLFFNLFLQILIITFLFFKTFAL